MKKFLYLTLAYLVVGFLFGTNTYAAASQKTHRFIAPDSGFYVGAILGASNTHYGNAGFDDTKNSKRAENGMIDSSGFGFRGLAGYQFNKYFASEVGYTHFDKTKGRGLNYTDGTSLNKSGEINENAVDLMAKGILPLVEHVALYAKVGVAYVWNRTKVATMFTKNRSGVKPAYAGGVTFNITDHFALDASYNRIWSNGRIKSPDLLGVGFYYQF